jgi:ribosomal-protein-alanine N-acetyltransferase
MSRDDAEIVRATPAEADALANLHARVFEAAWDAGAFARLLQHPGAVAFIARRATAPDAVGFILGRLAADEAEILSLGVLSARRRQGVATRLVAALSDAARRAAARKIYLEVAADNGDAARLYAGLGFAEVGRRAAYYRSPTSSAQDALLLCLRL